MLCDPRIDPGANHEDIFSAACGLGHFEIVKLLLSDGRVSPIKRQYRALKESLKNGFAATSRLLLSHESHVDLNPVPIKEACEGGDADILKLLLTYDDFDVNQKILVGASQLGFEKIFKLLLACDGVNLHFSSLLDMTNKSDMLWEASKGGHYEIVKLLLNDSAINPTVTQQRSFVDACSHGKYEVVKLYLDDSRVNPSRHNNKAIFLAANNNHPDVVLLLLSNEIVYSTVDKVALMKIACAQNQLHVVMLLSRDVKLCSDDYLYLKFAHYGILVDMSLTSVGLLTFLEKSNVNIFDTIKKTFTINVNVNDQAITRIENNSFHCNNLTDDDDIIIDDEEEFDKIEECEQEIIEINFGGNHKENYTNNKSTSIDLVLKQFKDNLMETKYKSVLEFLTLNIFWGKVLTLFAINLNIQNKFENNMNMNCEDDNSLISNTDYLIPVEIFHMISGFLYQIIYSEKFDGSIEDENELHYFKMKNYPYYDNR
jgi:hypothetical protein